MSRQRIFLVNQTDESQKFGVGKYISEMVTAVRNQESKFEMVVVIIGVEGLSEIQKRADGNVTYLNIPKPFSLKDVPIVGLSKQFSQGVFLLLTDLFEISNTDIFHCNSNMQHFLLKKIKENTQAIIIYTLHVCLWKVLYDNTLENFLSEWNDPASFSVPKKNIQAEKLNCQLSDRVICLSDSIVADVNKYYELSNAKIKKVVNGISGKIPSIDNNKLLKFRNRLGIQSKEFVVLFVGRINRQKGIVELLKVFEDILESTPISIKLVVVGDGPLRDELSNRYKQWGNSILFTGYAAREDINIYYSIADIVVFPTWNEECPYTMLEVMVHEKPLLVSDIKAFQVLTHNYDCLKIPFIRENILDLLTFKKLLITLLLDKDLSLSLVSNAKIIFNDKFSGDKMFLKTYAFDTTFYV